MPANRGLKLAYDAQVAAGKAIAHLSSLPHPLTTDQALALARLIDSLDTITERIRILRGRPLPGTLQPSRMKKAKPVPKQRRRDVEPVDLPTPPAATSTTPPAGTAPGSEPEGLTEYPG